jgi:hypothetical protein
MFIDQRPSIGANGNAGPKHHDKPKKKKERQKKRQTDEVNAGALIPVYAGTVKLRGELIWASKSREVQQGKKKVEVRDIAVLFGRNAFDREAKLIKLWLNDELIDKAKKKGNDHGFRWKFHDGSDPAEDRDDLIRKVEDNADVSAWRGFTYMTIRGVKVEKYGDALPTVTAKISSYTDLSADTTEFIAPLSDETGALLIQIWAVDWDRELILYERADSAAIAGSLVCVADLALLREISAVPLDVDGRDLDAWTAGPFLRVVEGTTYALAYLQPSGGGSELACIDWGTGKVLSTLDTTAIVGTEQTDDRWAVVLGAEFSVSRERLVWLSYYDTDFRLWVAAVDATDGTLELIDEDFSLGPAAGAAPLPICGGVSKRGYPCVYALDASSASERTRLIVAEYNGRRVRSYEVRLAEHAWNAPDAVMVQFTVEAASGRMLVNWRAAGDSSLGAGKLAIVDLKSGEVEHTLTTPYTGADIGRPAWRRYARGHAEVYHSTPSDWHQIIDLETGEVVIDDRDGENWEQDEAGDLGYRLNTDLDGNETFEVRFYPGYGDTGITLDDLLADLAVLGGYDRADISSEGVSTIDARGWIIDDEEFSPLDVMRRICDLYGILIVEVGEGLRFVKRATDGGYAVDVTVDEADLVRDSDEQPVVEAEREAELDLPGIVEVEYHSTDTDEVETSTARRPSTAIVETISEKTDTYSVPLFLSDEGAAELAYERLYSAVAAAVDVSFVLPPALIRYEPGDVVRLALADLTIDVQIVQTDIREDLTVACVGRSTLRVRDMTSDGDAIDGPDIVDKSGRERALTQSIAPALIAATGGVFAPGGVGAGSQSIEPPLIAATGGVFAPEITAPLAATILPGLIAATGQVFAPTVAQTITAPLIAATGGIYAPTVVDANADPYWADVVFLSGFEGADASTTFANEKTSASGTAVGNAQVDTAQKKYGSSSALLDGTGDAIEFPFAADLCNLSTANNDPFTIEAWVRLNVTGTWKIVCSAYEGLSDRAWILEITNGNQLALYFYGSGSSQNVTTTGTALTTGQWYHFAVDKDSSGKIRIYIDGVMRGSATPANSTLQGTTAAKFRVGSWQNNSSEIMNGWIDELRVTKNVARYASDSGFTPPTAAYPRS